MQILIYDFLVQYIQVFVENVSEVDNIYHDQLWKKKEVKFM